MNRAEFEKERLVEEASWLVSGYTPHCSDESRELRCLFR